MLVAVSGVGSWVVVVVGAWCLVFRVSCFVFGVVLNLLSFFLPLLCTTAGQLRTNLGRVGHCVGFFHGVTSNATVRRRRRRSIAIHCDGVDRHDVVDWFYVENQCPESSGRNRNSRRLRRIVYGFYFDWVVCVGGREWVVHSSQNVAVLCSLLCS